MAQKRRRHSAELQNEHNKRPKNAHHATTTTANSQPSPERAYHHVLSAYFPTLFTLRKYLIARLTSLKHTATQEHGFHMLLSDRVQPDTLSQLLDSALVGFNGDVPNGNTVKQDITKAAVKKHLWRNFRGPSQSEVTAI